MGSAANAIMSASVCGSDGVNQKVIPTTGHSAEPVAHRFDECVHRPPAAAESLASRDSFRPRSAIAARTARIGIGRQMLDPDDFYAIAACVCLRCSSIDFRSATYCCRARCQRVLAFSVFLFCRFEPFSLAVVAVSGGGRRFGIELFGRKPMLSDSDSMKWR